MLYIEHPDLRYLNFWSRGSSNLLLILLKVPKYWYEIYHCGLLVHAALEINETTYTLLYRFRTFCKLSWLWFKTCIRLIKRHAEIKIPMLIASTTELYFIILFIIIIILLSASHTNCYLYAVITLIIITCLLMESGVTGL